MRTWRFRIGCAAGLLVAVMSAGGHVAASNAPLSVVLHVELVEQAECLVGSDAYRVLFEVRTIYVNRGRVPVTLGVGTEQILAARFAPAGSPGDVEDEVLSFAAPPDAARGVAASRVVLAPGMAATGRTGVWVPLTTGLDATSLAPGPYTARFDVGVMIAESGSDVAPLEPARLSTAPLTVTIHRPTQVQECGDARSLRAP